MHEKKERLMNPNSDIISKLQTGVILRVGKRIFVQWVGNEFNTCVFFDAADSSFNFLPEENIIFVPVKLNHGAYRATVSGQLKPASNGHFLKPKTSHPVYRVSPSLIVPFCGLQQKGTIDGEHTQDGEAATDSSTYETWMA